MHNRALYDKLVSRIRKDENGCWLWTGPVRPSKWPQNRYGMTSWNGRSYNAHRAMVIAVHGPQPRETCACHRCDVPLCINPEHLFLGTMGDNIRDSRSKNRHHEGQKTHCHKGHPLSGDNLYLSKQGGGKVGLRRSCKACQDEVHKKPSYIASRREYQRLRRLRLKSQVSAGVNDGG